MKKIDYVIISSDDNPLYKDFYPIISKRWFDLGIKTYYINITDSDESLSSGLSQLKQLSYLVSTLI